MLPVLHPHPCPTGLCYGAKDPWDVLADALRRKGCLGPSLSPPPPPGASGLSGEEGGALVGDSDTGEHL